MIKFNYTERFTCAHCGEVWLFRADSMTVLVAKIKSACNAEIQEHYVMCQADKAIKQADSFDSAFCKFLKSIGINASIIKEDSNGFYEGS